MIFVCLNLVPLYCVGLRLLAIEAAWRSPNLKQRCCQAQVYALSKERDALRRGSDKLTSASALLKEKDDIIQQARPLFIDLLWCSALSAACHSCVASAKQPFTLVSTARHRGRRIWQLQS